MFGSILSSAKNILTDVASDIITDKISDITKEFLGFDPTNIVDHFFNKNSIKNYSSKAYAGKINPEDLVNFIKTYKIQGGGILKSNPAMEYFNNQLNIEFNPDINGRTLFFMVPPPFLGASKDKSYINEFRKLTCFAAMDFNPPMRQVNVEKTSVRSGSIPYAVEVEPTDQFSVTYVDNTDLDVYNFHLCWIDYIKDVVLGYIEPPSIYLSNSKYYMGLDYAASLFVVKYDPSMTEPIYVGKATGCFPQAISSKEIIGQRTTNDISLVSMTYMCAYYEETCFKNHPIFAEFVTSVLAFYSGAKDFDVSKTYDDVFSALNKGSDFLQDTFGSKVSSASTALGTKEELTKKYGGADSWMLK